MSARFHLVIYLTGILCAVPAMSWAVDVCSPVYRPLSGKYLVSAEETASLKLSPAERGAILSSWQEYGEKMPERLQDFEFERAELINKLDMSTVSRADADSAAVRMLSILDEIARRNVDWQRTLSVNISIGHMSSLATAHRKSRKHSAQDKCSAATSRLGIPLLRYDINDREKALIALTEEEQAYLDQFAKNSLRLRDEYRSLAAQLDQELSRREPEIKRLETLSGLLALNMRQEVTNALDCYFYGEANIFSPERMAKLKKYWSKHKKKKK